jgi:hypothetical protein
MPDRRGFIVKSTALAASALTGLAGCDDTKGQKMQAIEIDLGKDIVETARSSGVPEFQAQKVNNTIIYSVTAIPPERPVRFTRSGYEIVWQPAFGLDIYGSVLRGSIADSASISLDSNLTSHAAAQAFVEQTVAQFAKGKWQRYHDPVWDVLLTGRSSMLDEAGHIATTVMTIDPAYKVPPVDWPALAKSGPIWRWVGDGVLASLTIGFTERETSAAPQYSMDLEFELLDVYTKQLAENGDQKRKEGDAKGWNSTAKHEAAKKERAELNKRLIANAIKRGDQVVSR